MRQVTIFFLDSINNIGETLLGGTTEYLLHSNNNDLTISKAQFCPSLKRINSKYYIEFIIGHFFYKLARQLQGTLRYKLLNISFGIKYWRYYNDVIKRSDKIVMAIGMYKYETQNFSYLFSLINKIAAKNKKTIMLSAMSPQAANKKDYRYLQLVKATNQPSVKVITTRDGDNGVNIFKRDYIRDNCPICDYVGDPALWVPECYGIPEKEKTTNKIPYIGINIIRKGLSKSYHGNFSDNDIIETYKILINQVKRKGWRWSLFTNGMPEDILVLDEIVSAMNIDSSHISRTQLDGYSYVKLLSQFDVVFGARLHACITSVALNIPVVGFYWEDKVRNFCKVMKIEELFFEPDCLDGNEVFKRIEHALTYKYDLDNKKQLKDKTNLYIKKFMDI